MKNNVFHFTKLSVVCMIMSGLCIFQSSCYSARVYAPHPQVIPGFTEKGQGRISIHSVSDRTNDGHSYANRIEGFSMQAAYAPINHVGLTLNYTRLKNRDMFRQFEFACGYFIQPIDKVILETYVGYGTGSMHSGKDFSFNVSNDDNDPSSYDFRTVYSYVYGDMDNKRWFIQPSVTAKLLKVMELAVGLKCSSVDFYNLRIEKGEAPTKDYDEDVKDVMDQIARAELIEQHDSYTMIEPSITLRIGIERLKVQFQVGSSSTRDKDLQQVIYRGFNSVGLVYSFPGPKKNPK